MTDLFALAMPWWEFVLRAGVSQADFDEAMREADCANVDEIHLALLETNGRSASSSASALM